MTKRSLQRVLTAGEIILIGCLTFIVHLYHLYRETGLHNILLGTAFPLLLSSLLVISGIWLYQSELDSTHMSRIAMWAGIGLLSGVVFGYPVVPYQAEHGITIVDTPFLAVIWATTGTLGGFLIGFYDTRQRQYRDALETDRAELIAREEELERQNDRLERFASMLSHDLRNPLNVATGRLDLAQQECDTDHLEPAATALERMERLIENVLSVARQGQPIEDTARVSLSTAADQAWTVVDTQEATPHVEDDLMIEADPNRLQRLFENLFRNAVEHGRADVTVTIGNLENGFYVADDGPGIPADEREQVFESGYSTSSKGTGFGLEIIKQIIDAHGWEIAITDSGEGGARFEITGIEFTDN